MNSLHEIEAKFKISQDESARLQKLLKSHFQYERFEINEFYDTKKCKLDKRDQILRIRATASFEEGNKYIVTFKGAPIRSKFKSRPEYETEVNNVNAVRAMFESLGYVKFFSFEKMRKNYDNFGCCIEIDEIPELGFFCEIEGITEKVIEEAQLKLGLSNLESIKDGYGMLLWKHAKKNKIKQNEVKFYPCRVDVNVLRENIGGNILSFDGT